MMFEPHVFDCSYATEPGQELRCVLCSQPKDHPMHAFAGHYAHRIARERLETDGHNTKRLVGTGALTVADALYDHRARGLEVIEVLNASPALRGDTARSLLGSVGISQRRKVRELTPVQRKVLADRATETVRKAA